MGDQSHDAPGFEQFYALILERPRILEGVVDRIRGKLVQVQGNVNQVQGDLGTMNRRVYSLGQDIGALRGEISTLESSVTSQLGSNDRYITQMLAGMLGSDKPQLQEVRVAGNQQAVVGRPSPPGPVLNLCLPPDRTMVSQTSYACVTGKPTPRQSVSLPQGQPHLSSGYSGMTSVPLSTICSNSICSAKMRFIPQ